VTPNSDWWDRAKLPPRSRPIEIRKPERLRTFRKAYMQGRIDAVYREFVKVSAGVSLKSRRLPIMKNGAPAIQNAMPGFTSRPCDGVYCETSPLEDRWAV